MDTECTCVCGRLIDKSTSFRGRGRFFESTGTIGLDSYFFHHGPILIQYRGVDIYKCVCGFIAKFRASKF